MLALVYLALMFWVGDAICRRFYRFVSVPHRLAAAFLVGMLTSSWFTYLTARIFMRTARPLLWGDLLFFAAIVGAFVWVTWKEKTAWATSTGKLKSEPVTPLATIQPESSALPAQKYAASADELAMPETEKVLTLPGNGGTMSPLTPKSVSAPTSNPIAPPSNAADASASTAEGLKGSPTLPKDDIREARQTFYLQRRSGSDRLDWVFIGAYFILAAWLMFATFNSSGGKLHTSTLVLSDFANNVSLVQSFAVGKNFPTQLPHFAGEKIRYHFLFWFQAGNLEFLGLDPALSINLLSIFSVVALLIVMMVLGEVLFSSRAVGYVASALFFFFGSLSYIPFLGHQGSVGNAFHAISTLDHFLPSIWPQVRGETWGNYTQAIFVNQRHFAGAIAILLLVLIFLVLSYREVPLEKINWRALKVSYRGRAAQHESATANVVATAPSKSFWATAAGFIFSGVLLGLLPMWNSAVFIAAFAFLLFLFILLPLRKQMLALAVTTGIIALPQVIYLTRGGFGEQPLSAVLHWGYLFSPGGCRFCFDNPTIWFVLKYLGFTIGFKWLPVAVALVFATRLQRRFFVAALGLVAVTFLFQLSASIVDNHKYLHVWIIIINLFAAYGLYRIWTMKALGIAGRIAAIVLAVAIVTGGVIDLFPIHNVKAAEADFQNDQLIDWVRTNTKGDAIFLSDQYFWHPILLAGRKIFFGYQFLTWAAGYDLGKREPVYKRMFESNDPAEVFRLLKENGIDYIAYDDAIRRGDYIRKPNEQVYAKNFQKVWVDTANHYGHLAIYKVPEVAPPGLQSAAPEAEKSPAPAPAVSMFTGGRGTGPGQFDNPQGLAIDRAGNILVSDMSNARIEKFSPKGDFISSFGQRGWAEGELVDPFGIVIDRNGNIYVVEAGSGRIQKFKPDGTSVVWKRNEDELDMYGPRKIALGPDDSLYVVDMGHVRIIKFNLEGRQTAHWGTAGEGDGQFKDMTSVAVDPRENRVYVADPGNKRIQIFDPNGKFLGKWPVEEWGTFFGFEDLAIDPQARRLYASSATMDNILVFDLNGGTRLASLQPKPPDKLEAPTAIALSKGKLYVLNNRTARVSVIDLVETKK